MVFVDYDIGLSHYGRAGAVGRARRRKRQKAERTGKPGIAARSL